MPETKEQKSNKPIRVGHRDLFAQQKLLTLPETVLCIRCLIGLATLIDLREGGCAAGGSHEVSRLDYFALYRLASGVEV